MKRLLILIILFSSVSFGQPQPHPEVFVDLTIENQQVVGTDFFFDLYLRRADTNTNDLYLGTADFVLTFNSSAFSSPVLTRESVSFWNLTSTSGIPVGAIYRTATSAEPIIGNMLIINLEKVTFGDQSDFDDNVARIDNQPATHRLGRYKVSGISNPAGNMNLKWKTTGGLKTIVYTLDPTPPFYSYEATINTFDPDDTPLPVELTSFTAAASGNSVELKWETKTEVNNYGFEIERQTTSPQNIEAVWERVGFVNGCGNSNSPKKYSFTDKNVQSGDYSYRLKQIDTDGQFEYSFSVNVVIDIPTDYVLEQNYPNPFNPSTTIKYSIREDGIVKLTIYNLIGEKVITLVDEQKQAGIYTELFNASALNSGVYFYELRINGVVLVKKLQLIK